MANRLSYYFVVKQIHLISSMILLAFVFVFLITGIVIANRQLFELPERSQEVSKVPVKKQMTGSPEEYSNYLKKEFGYKGREFQRKEKNGNWIFQFNFQGTNHQVTLTPKQDTLTIRTNTEDMNLLSFSTKLHHMRGFKGGLEYTLWAIFYDLTAVAFMVFALTGILMWLKLRVRYKSGWFFLLLGIAIPVTIILLFLYTK